MNFNVLVLQHRNGKIIQRWANFMMCEGDLGNEFLFKPQMPFPLIFIR